MTKTKREQMATHRKVLFSHQSVGRNIIANPVISGNTSVIASQHIRDELDMEVEFHDHDYRSYQTYEGLFDSGGTRVGNGYPHRQKTTEPANDADTVGMEHLIGDAFHSGATGDAEDWRDFCSTFDICMIKPGYRDVHLTSDQELQDYKDFLEVASDWWHDNNPGKYFCVMTSSPLRRYSDYHVGSSGFLSGTSVEQTDRYNLLEKWLTKTWVTRNPENRVFPMFRKCTNQSGVDENFTLDAYKSSDHHLNSVGSDAMQEDLVSFINTMVSDMNTPFPYVPTKIVG